MTTDALTIDEEIAAFDPPNADWAALQAASLRFLESPYLGAVIQHDWSELETWGCYPSADIAVVKRRADCAGLVVGLSLGVGCSIERIGPHEAVVSRKATGSRLTHRRALTGREAVLWWDAPRIAEGRRS